ncbi:MAG: hypothetical protein OXH65_00575 [Paracoccaceae bacterium]|nr:hypothetical protein [Paracoccaceae bacterium]MDE2673586.1 hypothetical protein [Paracoccaceae bacterium]
MIDNVLKLLQDILPSFTALAALIIPFAVVSFSLWLRKGQYAITWVAITPKSMTDFADELLGKLDVKLDGKSVTNLTKYKFILHNSGRKPIVDKAITSPLTWIAPGKILEAKVVATHPQVDMIIDVSGTTAEFRWKLFNQRSQALVEILCDVEEREEDGKVSAQIKGIPEIRNRSIWYIDEEEIRRRHRRQLFHKPGSSTTEFSIRLSILLNRYLSQIFWVIFWMYGSLFIAFLMSSKLASEQFENNWPIWVAIWFSVLIIVLWISISRNPYTKLLRS